jgi:hypothetical protein
MRGDLQRGESAGGVDYMDVRPSLGRTGAPLGLLAGRRTLAEAESCFLGTGLACHWQRHEY